MSGDILQQLRFPPPNSNAKIQVFKSGFSVRNLCIFQLLCRLPFGIAFDGLPIPLLQVKVIVVMMREVGVATRSAQLLGSVPAAGAQLGSRSGHGQQCRLAAGCATPTGESRGGCEAKLVVWSVKRRIGPRNHQATFTMCGQCV